MTTEIKGYTLEKLRQDQAAAAVERSKVEAHTIANCTLLESAVMAHELLIELGAGGRIVTQALGAAIGRASE